jgi:hypothetical protein
MEPREETISARRVTALPRVSRIYPEGRVCAHPGCFTVLSRYNAWDRCWEHEPMHRFVPRGKRTSRSGDAA